MLNMLRYAEYFDKIYCGYHLFSTVNFVPKRKLCQLCSLISLFLFISLQLFFLQRQNVSRRLKKQLIILFQ